MYRDGVSDEDRRRLFQHAKLSTMDQDAVNGLTYLGMRVMRVRRTASACFLRAESDRYSIWFDTVDADRPRYQAKAEAKGGGAI